MALGLRVDHQPRKRIDYKSMSDAPALEMPPEAVAAKFDDRYTVNTASARRGEGDGPKASELLRTNADAPLRVATSAGSSPGRRRAGVEHVAPVLERERIRPRDRAAVDRRMETDWREPRRYASDFLPHRRQVHRRVSSSTSAKFRTRIERAPIRHVEISISHRGMEQNPNGEDRRREQARASRGRCNRIHLERDAAAMMQRFGVPKGSGPPSRRRAGRPTSARGCLRLPIARASRRTTTHAKSSSTIRSTARGVVSARTRPHRLHRLDRDARPASNYSATRIPTSTW